VERISPITEYAGFRIGDALRGMGGSVDVKLSASCVAGVVSWLCGGIDQLMATLVLFWAIDFCLGFARAIKTASVSSAKMKAGAGKLILYGFAVIVGHHLDGLLHSGAHVAFPLAIRDAVACYLALNEAISIFEHLSFYGVPLPAPLLKRLRTYRDGVCEGEGEDK
jgi:toxin secretion/phage lysis holin